MKKILFAFILLGSAYQLKAQQLQPNAPDNLRGLLDNSAAAKAKADSWNRLKDALKLNDIVALNNNKLVFSNADAFRDNMPVAVLEGNSKMPVLKLEGYSKMPVLNLGPVDLNKLNRQKLTRFY